MKYKKMIAYGFLPVALGFGLLSAGVASAHSMGGFGGGFKPLSADEIVLRQQTMFQHQADILGLSLDEVKNAWSEGKNFKELATAKGISEATIQAKLKEAHQKKMKAELQTLVDKQVITQAQADKRLQALEKMMAGDKKGRLFGRGMHGGRPGFADRLRQGEGGMRF